MEIWEHPLALQMQSVESPSLDLTRCLISALLFSPSLSLLCTRNLEWSEATLISKQELNKNIPKDDK